MNRTSMNCALCFHARVHTQHLFFIQNEAHLAANDDHAINFSLLIESETFARSLDHQVCGAMDRSLRTETVIYICAKIVCV